MTACAVTTNRAEEDAPEPIVTLGVGVGSVIHGDATHYGQSYNGQRMFCPPYEQYWSFNTSIVAVGPARYYEWPCGTQLEIQGPCGTPECSIIVTRSDSCGGCGPNRVDLSEQGNAIVCGEPYWHTCNVDIRRYQQQRQRPSEE